jgi:hypothetical protein
MNTPETTPLTDEQFCVAEIAQCARRMSYPDSFRLLRGFLKLAGDAPEVHDLRDAVLALDAADAQLELLASPQIKLPLEDRR